MNAIAAGLGIAFAAVAATAPLPHDSERSRFLTGDWPANSPRVSLDLEHVKTRDALKRLAGTAHWGITFKDSPRGSVDAVYSDVPADEVLLAILRDSGLVAERHGDMLVIRERPGSVSDAKSEEEPARATGLSDGGDKAAMGWLHVGENETVKDAVTLGGMDVEGTVQGNAVALGGTVKLGPKAVVHGDAVSIGGHLDIDPGAKVYGSRVAMDLGSLGTFYRRSKHPEPLSPAVDAALPAPPARRARGWVAGIAAGAAHYAVFFVVALLLVTFVPERTRAISNELRRAPGHCLGIGLAGAVTLLPLTVLLIVTLLGIPVAILLWFCVPPIALLGFTSLALEVGARIPPGTQRTQVAVLGLGILVLFLVSLVPFVGAAVLGLAGLASFGAVLRTRLGNRGQDANFAPQP